MSISYVTGKYVFKTNMAPQLDIYAIYLMGMYEGLYKYQFEIIGIIYATRSNAHVCDILLKNMATTLQINIT